MGLLFLNLVSCISEDESKFVATRKSEMNVPPFEKLADSLSRYRPFRLSPERVLVLNFNSPKENQEVGEFVAERLTTELVKKSNSHVLDRGINAKVLQEKGYSLRGDVDIETMKKISNILNLDFIITGIIYSGAGGYFVNARLIDTKSGLIQKAEEVFLSVE